MKIGIFIEPDIKLKNKILFWKKKFNKKTNKIFYLNHPPHMTICTKSIKMNKFAKINLLKNLNKILSREKSFELKFNRNSIFKKKSFALRAQIIRKKTARFAREIKHSSSSR